jgi:hypothetical protein
MSGLSGIIRVRAEPDGSARWYRLHYRLPLELADGSDTAAACDWSV